MNSHYFVQIVAILLLLKCKYRVNKIYFSNLIFLFIYIFIIFDIKCCAALFTCDEHGTRLNLKQHIPILFNLSRRIYHVYANVDLFFLSTNTNPPSIRPWWASPIYIYSIFINRSEPIFAPTKRAKPFHSRPRNINKCVFDFAKPPDIHYSCINPSQSGTEREK